MKRDFLEKLGLSKAAIDAVMAEHGKAIEELRQRLDALQKEAAVASSLAEEKAALSATLAETISSFEAFRDNVIASMAADAKPSSEMAKEALIRHLTEAAQQGGDLRDTVRCLKEQDPNAFRKEGETVLPVFSAVSFASEEDVPSLALSMRRR